MSKKPKVDKGDTYRLGQALGEDARKKTIAWIKKIFKGKKDEAK